jgi:hypothetical protein
MKIITSVMVISCMIFLSLSAGACDSGPGQTTSTENTTTNNQSIQTIIEGESSRLLCKHGGIEPRNRPYCLWQDRWRN